MVSFKEVQQTQIHNGGGPTQSELLTRDLNRVYGSPVTAPVPQRQVLKVQQPLPSASVIDLHEVAPGQFASIPLAVRPKPKPFNAVIGGGGAPTMPNVPVPPEAKIKARAAQLQQQSSRYGSSRGTAIGRGFGDGFNAELDRADDRQRAESQARSEWYETQNGKDYLDLKNDFINTYGAANGWENYVATIRSQGENGTTDTDLQDFAKLRAQEAYNDKLQKSLDDYESKPENRRKTYDRGVANGTIKPPSGYVPSPEDRDIVDRIKRKYGDERTVNDVKPYADLTPDYSKVMPDIIYGPNGITYAEPGDHPDNIPFLLVSPPVDAPINFEQPGNNNFSDAVLLTFFSPSSRSGVSELVTDFSIEGPIYRDRNNDEDCMQVRYTVLGGGTTKQPFRPDSLKVSPYRGSNTRPTNRPTTPAPEQQIPTTPDGKADLSPFNPVTSDPTSPRQSAPNPTQPRNTTQPKLSNPGKLDTPQQEQPQLDFAPSPTPAGWPDILPFSPLNPRVPSTGVGENNPVKAPSINSKPTTANLTTSKPAPMVPVPTTKNPTETTTDTALKATEQLQPKTETETGTQKARQCEDPCIQGLHDKADENAKQTEIKVKVFKACSKTGTDGKTTNEIDFEEKTIKVPSGEADAYKLLYERIFELESHQCNDANAVASMPEWWKPRRGSDIPQLAIIFAEQFKTGKLGDGRWTLHIPHYSKPRGFKPSVPGYSKGNFQGILKLNSTDGTKIVVNAATDSECKRMINKLKILIPVNFRVKNGKAIKPRVTQDPDGGLKECQVIPIRGDFYSKGQLNSKPDWSIDLRKRKKQ